ncbi:MAG: hypothetical protein JXB14_02575 [Candidatus Altiarchaeota archaeon]|nr:hypothetical protein [Candidatus Altiarchaeota archaeon]
MKELELLLIFLTSLLLGYLSIWALRGRLLRFGVGGIDINKAEKPRIPEAGGMLLLPGIWAITLSLLYFEFINPMAYLFIFTTTCFAAIGFFDDGFRLFKRSERWGGYLVKRALVLFALTLPFAYLNFGIFDPLFTIWGGVVIMISASLVNSFAGLNGWEVGSSLIILVGLSTMALFSNVFTISLLALASMMAGSILALLLFNRYPARIFPGDSGTLLMGSSIGCIMPFIDLWYFAIPLFLPHIYDIYLKLRTNPKDISQKKEKPYVLKEGVLEVPPSGKLDFAKRLMRLWGPAEEKRLVRRIWTIVLLNTAFWTILYMIVKGSLGG